MQPSARIFLACLVLPLVCGATTATPKPTQSSAATRVARLAASAPVDAYFGPFGMSPLSIRSTIGLLGRQYHARTLSDHDVLHKAVITEDALRVWRVKYPADPWMAPTFYHLEQLYQAVQTAEARGRATALLHDIAQTYPKSKEAHLSRARLAAGFPALVPESPLVATPAPGPSGATPDGDPSAAPASADPVPAPAASGSPRP